MSYPSPYVLVLYYSAHGSCARLAQCVGQGIEKIEGMSARLRTVPKVSAISETTGLPIPEQGPPYVTLDDLSQCSGLALGSPGRFGSMAAPLKYFFETTTPIWLSGDLIGKPAAVFTSTSTMHGGQEATLLSLMIPLFHHGMILMGIPYSEPALTMSNSGGSPYGASHVAGHDNQKPFTEDEKQLSVVLGERISKLAKILLNTSERSG